MENKKYEFWTDKIAREIIERKKFHFTDNPILKFNSYVVKTSASLSGVLHIGRLSDTIRSEAVHRSLKDMGVRTQLIWVAEDMDPLRRIPEGVSKNYVDYIGMPVTDIPDPNGCHKSYAEHHASEYFKVLDEFVLSKMKKFSMREEYKKGNFKKYIKFLLKNVDEIIKIQNEYRETKLPKNWSPWKPICENCGKIITSRVTKFENGKVFYKCEDYSFEKNVAKGCGYEGENNPLKGNGKLMWKSEWAAQWARWKVCSEGAGKEYQVPGSAFWVNGEILERILNFPMPVPIFYEHLTINGKKMSASLGNVVYPYEWFEVATPELLRLLFLKDPMRERNFRWTDISNLMDEYDELEKIYYGVKKVESERDLINSKRLFESIQIKPLPKKYEHIAPFSVFVEIAKILPEEKQMNFAIDKLREFGHLKIVNSELEKKIKDRLELAKKWYEKFGKPMIVEFKVSDVEKKAITELIEMINKEDDGEKLQYGIFEIAKKGGIKPVKFFQLIYKIILNQDKGPRLGPYIIERGKEEIIEKLEKNI